MQGLPPLVSRRVLDILTYLASNHSSVADILFYFDSSLASEPPLVTHSESKEKGKEVILDAMDSSTALETPHEGDIPLIIFLKLLKRPLFLRSNSHLEKVLLSLALVFSTLNHLPLSSGTYACCCC